MMVVSSVGDFPEGAIGLQEGVFSLHDVTVAVLVLRLVVTSMGVLNGVRVLVFWVSLWRCLFRMSAYLFIVWRKIQGEELVQKD